MTRLLLPYPPGVNKLWIPVVRRGAGGKTWPEMVLSPEAEAYKAAVHAALATLLVRPVRGRVWLRLDVFRPIWRGQEQNAPDADAPVKLLFDTLQRFAFDNDRLVRGFRVETWDAPERPRVEVEVEPHQEQPPPVREWSPREEAAYLLARARLEQVQAVQKQKKKLRAATRKGAALRVPTAGPAPRAGETQAEFWARLKPARRGPTGGGG